MRVVEVHADVAIACVDDSPEAGCMDYDERVVGGECSSRYRVIPNLRRGLRMRSRGSEESQDAQ